MIKYYSRDQVNDILQKNKELAKKDFDGIQYVENKKKQRLTEEELQQMLPKVKPKDQIFEEMKHNFKNSWKKQPIIKFCFFMNKKMQNIDQYQLNIIKKQKGPGYVNEEFSKVPVLKANILNTWQYERINLAERSYKHPKGYKGLKVPVHGNNFGEPSMEHLPEKFQNYIEDFSVKYEEFKYRPSKYGKLPIDERTEQFQNRKKEPFKLTNSKQSNNFGYDKHSTWETEIKTVTKQKHGNSQSKYQTKQSQY